MNMNEIEKLNELIQLNHEASELIKTNNYDEACSTYQKSYEISKDLDLSKQASALLNYGVSLFFNGNLNDAVKKLETAVNLAKNTYENDMSNSYEITSLYLRTIANLSLIQLTITKTKESIKSFKLCLEIIEKEVKENFRFELFLELLHIYFKIREPLDEYFQKIQDEEPDHQHDKKIISKDKVLLAIHKFLREKDFSSWIKILETNNNNFKDHTSYLYLFNCFNIVAMRYVKNGNMEEVKEKMKDVLKMVKTNSKLKTSEKILEEWKSKIECAIQIYGDILKFEEKMFSPEIRENYKEKINEKSVSNSGIARIILKHSLNFITNHENPEKFENIKNQIEAAIISIQENEYDFSSFDINNYDLEIIRSIKLLLYNLQRIRLKSILRAKLRQFVFATTGSEDISYFRNYYNEFKRYKNLKTYKERSLATIETGSLFTKINFFSTGKKIHFYKISDSENALLIQKGNTFNKLLFEKDIIQIKYSVKSKNLLKKYYDFRNPESKKNWLYLSFITTKRSIDLLMAEETIKLWFFGLYELIKKKSLKVHIMTISGFVVKKLKLRLIEKIKEELNINEDPEKKKISTIDNNQLIVGKMKKFLKIDPLGLDHLSFAKVLILYLKLFKVKLEELQK